MSSVKKNIVWQGFYQIVIIAMPLITSPYLARVLGAESLGIYSYSYSIAYYFSLFIMLGVNNYGNKSIAEVSFDKQKASSVFWNIYIIQLVTGIIAVIIYICTQCNGANPLIARLQILVLISSVLDINWFFFGMEKFKLTTIRSVVIKLASLVAILVFVKKQEDLWIYTLIMSGALLLNQVVLWLSIKKLIFRPCFNFEIIKKNVKPMLILFIPIVSVSIFKYMDKIMLGLFCDMKQVGYYENSEKIISIPIGLITAISTVMLPKMSYIAVKQDKYAFQKYMKMSITLSAILSAAIMFGLFAVANEFSVWFWGEEFSACGNLMKILAISIIFTAWSNLIRAQYLIPFGKEKIFITATILGAVVNLVINLSLMPRYGAVGTAIGTVMAEAALAIYQTIKIKKELPLAIYLKENYIYLIFGLVMYMVVRGVSHIESSLFIKVILEVFVGILVFVLEVSIYIRKNKEVKDFLFKR